MQGLAGVVKFQPGVPVKPMLAKPMTGISEVLLHTSHPFYPANVCSCFHLAEWAATLPAKQAHD